MGPSWQRLAAKRNLGPARRRREGFAIVLAATMLTLGVAYLLKLPCLGTPWDGRQYTWMCYSDVYVLYASDDLDRGLDEDRVPYLDGANEFPVLGGLTMYVAALPATSSVSFFHWSAAILGLGALATSWALERLRGQRALLFALAPTLAIYAFMSWDLVAVAFATLATLAFLRGRDGWSGVLLGLGAAAKLYPALFLLPFALQRLTERKRRAAALLAGSAAAAWLVVNLPFVLAAPERWSRFYRFNATRVTDWDSLWYPLEHAAGWSTAAVNALAAGAFALAAAAILAVWWRRRDALPAWTLGFPLLVAFLLTSKVYSPQYSLWLLPWFALVLPDLRLFAAFQIADVAVFVTRFQFFAQNEGFSAGVPQEAFGVALAMRAVVLVVCVVAWLRRARSREREVAEDPILEPA